MIRRWAPIWGGAEGWKVSRLTDQRFVSLKFRPLWAYIDGIREFCAFFCEATFGDPEMVERFRIVSHEALENAVKYSAAPAEDEVELEIYADEKHVNLTIINTASPEDIKILKEELGIVYSQAAEQAYAEAIERAMTLPEDSSRLGLARMRAEGRVELSIEEEDAGRLRLTAKAEL
jgi:hypothetical protein